MILKDYELTEIMGGGISATLINAFARAITTTINLGQIIGSAIRRATGKNYC